MLSGARIVIVAAAVGACIGAALALALTKRVTAGEEAVAARTLTPSAAAITAPAHETHFFVDASPPPKKGQVAAKKGHMNPSQQARRTGCLVALSRWIFRAMSTDMRPHPSPTAERLNLGCNSADFVVEVDETCVSVVFEPTEWRYYFGRLADPEDIARYGPLATSPGSDLAKPPDGPYSAEQIKEIAYAIAVEAVTT